MGIKVGNIAVGPLVSRGSFTAIIIIIIIFDMRIVLILLGVCLGAAFGEPPVRGRVYLPAHAKNPESRRYLPIGSNRPRSKAPFQQPRRPFPSDRALVHTPTTSAPVPQYQTENYQQPEILSYQPSSGEVPPNQPAISYHSGEQKSSRRYLPTAVPQANRGQHSFSPPSSGYGVGSKSEPEYPPANYDFEYNVLDEESGNDFGHLEGRRGDEVTGRYRVLLPDGRTQIVEYVADMGGYKPVVTYQGTANTADGYIYNKPGNTLPKPHS